MNWLKQSKLVVWQERDRNAIKLVVGFFFFLIFLGWWLMWSFSYQVAQLTLTWGHILTSNHLVQVPDSFLQVALKKMYGEE